MALFDPKKRFVPGINSFGKPKTPPGQVATAKFPVLTYGDTPEIDTNSWRFRDLVKHVGMKPAAKFVMQHAYGDYTTNNSLDIMLNEDVIFAHTFNGQPLPAAHGGAPRAS